MKELTQVVVTLALSCVVAPLVFLVAAKPAFSLESATYRNICIDQTFDAEDREDIVASINRWSNLASQTSIVLTVDQGVCQWSVFSVARGKEDVCIIDNSLACANIGGPNLWVIRHRIESQFALRGVMLHELGHLMGADHSKTGLMASSYGPQYNTIDAAAINEVAKFQKSARSLFHPFTTMH